MSGAAVLARARAAGVAVVAEGGNLRLRGTAQPPAGLLAELRMHKAEVVALLTAPRLAVTVLHTGNSQKIGDIGEMPFGGPMADPLPAKTDANERAAWVEGNGRRAYGGPGLSWCDEPGKGDGLLSGPRAEHV